MESYLKQKAKNDFKGADRDLSVSLFCMQKQFWHVLNNIRTIVPVLRLHRKNMKEENHMAIFEGAGVALVTPFTESGEVNYEKLEALLEEQIAGGTVFFELQPDRTDGKPSNLLLLHCQEGWHASANFSTELGRSC